jgi:hypothetical protein
MTRLILLTLLILLCNGPAYAEWVAVSGSDESGEIGYVDPATIRRKGDMVKMWELKDFKTVRTAGATAYLSIKTQAEFDCAEERMRMLAFSVFADNMGSGKVVWSNSDEGKWKPVEPGSVGEGLWKIACGK